jgi:serine/threonine protein kinase
MQPGNDKVPKPEDSDEPVATDLGATSDFTVSKNLSRTTDLKSSIDLYATQVSQQPSGQGSQNASGGSNAVKADSELSKSVPGFKIEHELGRGAFGVVYAARDEMLERRVAIKLPLINDPQLRQQYIDEARKAVKLDHPSIVPIYQVGKTTLGEPFVVQKLIEGKTLRQMLQASEERLPIDQVVGMMLQACLAVDAAHTSGIVHRDLKPENFLVEPSGRLYVADFGLAILDDDDTRGKRNEIAGTPLYMSPEQFSGRTEWLDGRSDIWAIGVILYELLSGKPPFTGKSLADLEDQIKHKDPRPIHQRNPSIPREFDTIFRKCCAKQVGDRFASVRELMVELDKVCRGNPTLETAVWSAHSITGGFQAMSAQLEPITRRTEGSSLSSGDIALLNQLSSLQESAKATSHGQPSLTGLFLKTMLVSVAVLGILSAVAWQAQWGPFATQTRLIDANPNRPDIPPGTPNSTAKIPSGTTNDTSPAVVPAEDTKVPKIVEPVPPSKPFRVSLRGGDGTHDSIAKAIADSLPGETIRVTPGIYRESVKVDRAIVLQGEPGARLMSTEAPCLDIRAPSDSRVVVDGLTIDCQAPQRNAIDIVGGTLIIRNSEVFASLQQSYDCIKVHEHAILGAQNCKFQSTEHAAIRGESNSVIGIRGCQFSFAAKFEEGTKRCGIQANNAVGEIKSCTFIGPCLAGIEWKDTSEKLLDIESCSFQDCHTSINTQNCQNVSVRGSKDNPNQIRRGFFGVSFVNSNVSIDWLDAEVSGDKNRVGIQATEKSIVKVGNANVRGFMCGSLIKESELRFNALKIAKTRFAGVLVDDSLFDGTTLELLQMSNFGLVVLSTSANVKVENLSVEAVEGKEGRTVSAVYATSGVIGFTDARFTNCLCGFFIDPSRIIIEDVGMPKRSTLADLLKSSKKPDSPLPETGGERMTLTNCDHSWIFNGTGTAKVVQLDGNLAKDRQVPTLLQQGGTLGDELEMEKLGEFQFVVRRKPK